MPAAAPVVDRVAAAVTGVDLAVAGMAGAGLLTVAVALVLSADGAYRLLTRGLGLPAWEAAVVAAVAELALIAEAVRAERSITRRGHPGGHQYAIAGIALGAGLVVSSNAQSLPEWLVRFSVPQLAALLWWMGARETITTHQGAGTQPDGSQPREGTTWLVSPRRLAVQAGLIAATDGVDDLHALTRARRVRALARVLHRHTHTRSATIRRWRARRVHRLAETADTATITAVADQLTRTHTVLAMAGLLTNPAISVPPAAVTPPVPPGDVSAPPMASSPVVASSPTRPAPAGDGDDATSDTSRHAAAVSPRDLVGAAEPTSSPPVLAVTVSPVGASPAGARPTRPPRPADVARVRAALAAGDLAPPVTTAAIAAHLGISREYAAAARYALHEATTSAHATRDGVTTPNPRPTPTATTAYGDWAGPAAEPSGPVEHPTVTAGGHRAATRVENPGPAQEAIPPRSVPTAESFTHA